MESETNTQAASESSANPIMPKSDGTTAPLVSPPVQERDRRSSPTLTITDDDGPADGPAAAASGTDTPPNEANSSTPAPSTPVPAGSTAVLSPSALAKKHPGPPIGHDFTAEDSERAAMACMIPTNKDTPIRNGATTPGKLGPSRIGVMAALIHPNKPILEDEEEEDRQDPVGRIRRKCGPPSNLEQYVCYREELGAGAYKTVYRGMDSEEHLEIAWNELKVDPKKVKPRESQRMEEEVKMLTELKHENVVRFYGSFVLKGSPRNGKSANSTVFITELMTSGTLKEFLRKNGKPKPKVLQKWCRKVLAGLNYLHNRKVIHRDIKCDNIFIDGTNSSIKIGDLGLATQAKGAKTSVIGTPEFMAPEMYKESYDNKVDIWAFGMSVLEMLTLEYPYSECSNAAQIFKKVSDGLKPRCFIALETDNTVRSRFLMRCICYEPSERASAAQLLKDPFFVGVAADAKSIAFSHLQTSCEARNLDDGTYEVIVTKVAQPEKAKGGAAAAGGDADDDDDDNDDREDGDSSSMPGSDGEEAKPVRHNITINYIDNEDTPLQVAKDMIEEGLINRGDKDQLAAIIGNAIKLAKKTDDAVKKAAEAAAKEDAVAAAAATAAPSPVDPAPSSQAAAGGGALNGGASQAVSGAGAGAGAGAGTGSGAEAAGTGAAAAADASGGSGGPAAAARVPALVVHTTPEEAAAVENGTLPQFHMDPLLDISGDIVPEAISPPPVPVVNTTTLAQGEADTTDEGAGSTLTEEQHADIQRDIAANSLANGIVAVAQVPAVAALAGSGYGGLGGSAGNSAPGSAASSPPRSPPRDNLTGSALAAADGAGSDSIGSISSSSSTNGASPPQSPTLRVGGQMNVPVGGGREVSDAPSLVPPPQPGSQGGGGYGGAQRGSSSSSSNQQGGQSNTIAPPTNRPRSDSNIHSMLEAAAQPVGNAEFRYIPASLLDRIPEDCRASINSRMELQMAQVRADYEDKIFELNQRLKEKDEQSKQAEEADGFVLDGEKEKLESALKEVETLKEGKRADLAEIKRLKLLAEPKVAKDKKATDLMNKQFESFANDPNGGKGGEGGGGGGGSGAAPKSPGKASKSVFD